MTQPYNLSIIQDQVQAILEGDPDTPTSGDEFNVRTTLSNSSILTWESERDVEWQELWTTNSTGGTIADGTTEYAAPAGFKKAGGFVRFVLLGVTTDIPVISPDQAQIFEDDTQVCYFIGNPQDGYTLTLNWTPATGDGQVGSTIQYDYYKFADTLATSTDMPEMSDPMYIVYKVCSTIFGQRSNFNMYTVYETMAQNSLAQMKLANATPANYQYNELADIEPGLGL